MVIILSFLFFPSLQAQDQGKNLGYYWVQFKDKNHSSYAIDRPGEFLSPRALARRERQGITVELNDLPVNEHYLEQLGTTGARVKHTSRWLNGATILLTTDSVERVAALPMVDTVFFIGRHYERRSSSAISNRRPENPDTTLKQEQPYGYGQAQITLIRGEQLHQLGYTGRGLLVGILDGGFINVDIIPFFDSLRASEGLVFHRDFVDDDDDVFDSSIHGTQVLSLMAANLPGILIGTAPDATYVCMKTENVQGEYRLEEYNWVVALEYADSLGVDVVNSSLGYTEFSDHTMDYSYPQLDGRTSIASQAASIAFSKGMIVVNSAGNEGNSKWRYIGVPADGDCIITVGATDKKGEAASFSSIGPTADGRIKPDLSAPGFMVATAAPTGDYRVKFGSGTSFAAPIIAGMIASLWQAFPDKTNAEILEAVRDSASLASRPDVKLGYGLPDFVKAYELLRGSTAGNSLKEQLPNAAH